MIFSRNICLTIFVVSASGLWGCANFGFQENGLLENSELLKEVEVSDSSMAPQTLEPNSENTQAGSATPEILSSESTQNEPKKEMVSPEPTEPLAPQPAMTQTTKKTTPKTGGKIFGEFVGVKTKWEEMKQQLVNQMQEHTRKTEELKVKLQLIEQIAEHVNFTTKAYVTQPNIFLAEFSIENRTAYAIKDLSITCDQIAPTGTIIQSHAETIYDIIKPTTRSTYAPIPFGTKHRQTQSLQCQITNFTVHNSQTLP